MAWSVARAIQRGLSIGIVGTVAAMFPGTAVLGATTHSVAVTIVAGKSAADGGYDFNGYQRGAMTVTVPVGWQVVVQFENADALPHSLAVLPSGSGQQAVLPSTPVFPGAVTKSFAAGLPKGAKQTLTFAASKPGTYEFVCGVPGHAIAGMWDNFVVSSTAVAPTVTPAGAAPIAAK